MKRKIGFLLCAAMLLSVFAIPVSAVSNIEDPVDVPKVLITTNGTINRDDYVDCTITFIDAEGGEYITIVDGESEIKIRGNSTSSADKKPYNIKLSSKTDVFGMGKNKKWCLLANCYDKTLIRNIAVFDFAEMAGVPYTPDYRVVDVYVNGELGGCYLLTDAIEVGSTRVDIDTDNNEFLLELDHNPPDEDCQYFNSPVYDIPFAINEPEKEDLTNAQYSYVTDLVRKAENALAGNSYSEVVKYFDIESLVNFYITLEFFKNIDVNTSSTRFHVKGGKIYGGPVWDFDLSSGNGNDDYYYGYNNYTDNDINVNTSYEGFWATNMSWFKRLMRFSEFQELVYDRYLELQDEIVNLYADNIVGDNKIDTYIGTYQSSFDRNNNEAGWKPDRVYHSSMQLERDPDPTYEQNVAFYRHWLEKRNEWLLDEWGLYSLLDARDDEYSTVDGFFVTNVAEGTTVSQLLSDYNYSFTSAVKRDGATMGSGDVVRTGDVLTYGGASYVVAVTGDVNGDGKVNSRDYIKVKRHCLKTYTLSNIEFIAADVNNTDKVDARDYLKIKRYILGTTSLV